MSRLSWADCAVVGPVQPAQTDGCMTILRQKLLDELEVRGLSRNTQESYIGHISRLARHYGRSPDKIGDEEVRAYLLHLLREKKNSAAGGAPPAKGRSSRT